MNTDDLIREEMTKYLDLAAKYNIEINGKNFVELIEILGRGYYLE